MAITSLLVRTQPTVMHNVSSRQGRASSAASSHKARHHERLRAVGNQRAALVPLLGAASRGRALVPTYIQNNCFVTQGLIRRTDDALYVVRTVPSRCRPESNKTPSVAVASPAAHPAGPSPSLPPARTRFTRSALLFQAAPLPRLASSEAPRVGHASMDPGTTVKAAKSLPRPFARPAIGGVG
jgi:hypothetical protein